MGAYEAECRNPACPTGIASLVARLAAGDDDAEAFLVAALTVVATQAEFERTVRIPPAPGSMPLALVYRNEALTKLALAERELDLERERFTAFYTEATRTDTSCDLETPCPACGEVYERVAL
jgi:hypothetical protein